MLNRGEHLAFFHRDWVKVIPGLPVDVDYLVAVIQGDFLMAHLFEMDASKTAMNNHHCAGIGLACAVVND